MPISAALRRVLLTAAHEAGVDVVRITSGGQPGSRGLRTGSNRHDGGNAADLELVARGRTLDFTRPADLDTICRFVASAAACGATGIGAGVNYMGPQRLHVGFGNGRNDTAQVVEGEGGAAANAPDLLSDAAQLGWAYSTGAPVSDGAAAAARARCETAAPGDNNIVCNSSMLQLKWVPYKVEQELLQFEDRCAHPSAALPPSIRIKG